MYWNSNQQLKKPIKEFTMVKLEAQKQLFAISSHKVWLHLKVAKNMLLIVKKKGTETFHFI